MEVNRRQFLKGAVVATGTAAVSAGLIGCTSKSTSSGTTQNQTTTPEVVKKSWRDAPDPIKDIAETVEADVVVVGAGVAGTCATLAAIQAGANTVCLQKGPIVLTHGGNFGGFNSRFQKEAGNPELNLLEVVNAHIRYNNHRPQFDLVKEIILQSAKTLEWLADETGTGYKVSKPSPKNDYGYNQPTFATGHATDAGKAIGLATKTAERAKSLGAVFYFDTPGEQLIKDASGRITGVVAKNSDGKYIQFNASKGVILATGDYGSNYELCADMCPWVVGTHNYYYPNNNTGDGHKMGTWVGAKMETLPHTKMAHVHNCIDGSDLTDSPIKNDPFLWVNQSGERFANEDMEYAMICNNVREQPGDVFYIVFDKNYNTQRAAFWNPKTAAVDPAAFTKAIELGYIVEGKTLEDAAKGFEIPADILTATVKRYNELAAKGKDEDFGKPAADLAPIKDAPYYIVRSYTPMDVTMGGLMINTKMQVLDENDKVISGLYAAGNTSGGFYGGTDYDLEVDAYSLGRAATTGRLAGEYAASVD